jgi:hypothetical protein
MRKANQNDLWDAVCQRDIHKILEKLRVRGWQETLRTRLEQHAGEMDDDINTFDCCHQSFASPKIGANNLGFTGHFEICGYGAPVYHQSEHTGVMVEEKSRKD